MTAKKAGVTGYPIAQSRSPLIHRYWLKKHGLDGTYDKIELRPEDAASFFSNLKSQGLAGCNVTVPNKEAAFKACRHLDSAAEAMGAANTLWLNEAGELCGANTDGLGFLGNLDQLAPGWDREPGPAVVIGAGGAARAIVWALLERKFTPVHIFNRTAAKAEELSRHFGENTIAHSLDKLPEYLENAALVVNTTSLGMTGKAPLDLDLDGLPADALVTDIVYSPLETDLLKQAKSRGNPTVDGLGMLLHQAVPGFEKWFGVTPEVDDALRQLILDDLKDAS